MGRKVLLLVWTFLSIIHLHGNDLDSLRSALIKAYNATDSVQADELFQDAKYWVTNDSTLAHYTYFKYFYFYKRGKKDSSDFYLFKALPMLKSTSQWTQYFSLTNNLFWDKVDESKYDEAVILGKKNIEFSKEIGDTQSLIGFHANLAIVYHDIAQYDKGIGIAKKGISLATNPQYIDDKSNCINAIGICFDDWGKPDSAIAYHRKNIHILKKLDPYGLSQSYNNLGNTYSKIDELDSAIKYITLASEMDKKDQNAYKLATSLNNLGGLYLRLKKYDLAKINLDTALLYSLSSRNNEKLRDVYFNLSKYYLETEQYKLAHKYQASYHTYKDSMLDNERIKIISDLESKAKEAQLGEQISKAKAATNLRNLWIVAVSAILLLTILIAYQLYIKRKRAQEESQLRLQNERLRISRDLHDNLGAELTYISSIVDQKAFSIKDPEKKAEMEQISSSSRHAMDQMRETIWAIKTNDINIERFALKILQTSKKYAESVNAVLKVNTSGDNVMLPPSVVIVLLRICQESINNAVKYAKCENIQIDINVENPAFQVEIKDDGIGFDINKVKKGYGLGNMKERIEEIGGQFNIFSTPTKGTITTISGILKEKYD
jgi:signal transduction histidine kinase